MGYKLFGVETGGLPMHLINPLIDYVNIEVFVETGTAGGDSIRKASGLFKECHTVELIDGIVGIEPIDNVTFYIGKSIDVLPKIVDNIFERKESENDYHYTLFWLDAHYSANVPNISEYKECYILEELEIISKLQAEAIIIIDDARQFLGRTIYPHNPLDWAGIQDIFALLKEKFPHNYSTVVDDYIISLPERIREPIDTEWRERFYIRYPSDSDKLKKEIKNVFEALAKYIA